jgi:hypothetical protein
MVAVGLVVEGIYDEAVLTELVRKCHPSEVDVICRHCAGAIQLMKTFPVLLKQFEHSNAGLPVDKALVIRDADHKNPDDMIAKMKDKIGGRTFSFSVKLLVVVEEMEAWLLADEEALASVTGRRQQRILNPETVYDPKERLRDILSGARIAYAPERARLIAAASRVDVLADRCPSFKRFQEAVVNA